MNGKTISISRSWWNSITPASTRKYKHQYVHFRSELSILIEQENVRHKDRLEYSFQNSTRTTLNTIFRTAQQNIASIRLYRKSITAHGSHLILFSEQHTEYSVRLQNVMWHTKINSTNVERTKTNTNSGRQWHSPANSVAVHIHLQRSPTLDDSGIHIINKVAAVHIHIANKRTSSHSHN